MKACWCLKRDAMTLFKRAIFKLGLTPDLAYRSAMKMGLAHLAIVGRRDQSLEADEARECDDALARRCGLVAHCGFFKGELRPDFINLKGREENGIVEPGSEYERVMREITDKLRALIDPETRQPSDRPDLASRRSVHGPAHRGVSGHSVPTERTCQTSRSARWT